MRNRRNIGSLSSRKVALPISESRLFLLDKKLALACELGIMVSAPGLEPGTL